MSNSEILLLDTNIILYLIKGDETVFNILNQQPVAINFIIEVELLSWPYMNNDLNEQISQFINDTKYLDYSTRIKNTAIFLRKKYKLKLADAFIAATAIENDLPLVSADDHFKKISEIRLVHITPSIL